MSTLFCLLSSNGTKSGISDDGSPFNDNDTSHSNKDIDGQVSEISGSQDSEGLSDSAGEPSDTGQYGPSYPFQWNGKLTIETGNCSATVRETGVEFTQVSYGIQLLENNPCPVCEEFYSTEDVEPLNACGVQFAEPIILCLSRSHAGFEVFQVDSQDGFVQLASSKSNSTIWSHSFEVGGGAFNAAGFLNWD